MRKPIIAANWKMYKVPDEARQFCRTLIPLVAQNQRDQIVICPSATSLAPVFEEVKGSNIAVGGQNMHQTEEGAYTGETSVLMLKAVGAAYVILGHSECRQYRHETDAVINAKVRTALHYGIKPIVCVGESAKQREAGETERIITYQVGSALTDISPELASTLAIAYEPIWAIGTGKTATPEMAAEAHLKIRSEVAHRYGRHIAEQIPILYGGSVKPETVNALLGQPEIDGALVGGASLQAESFADIINYSA